MRASGLKGRLLNSLHYHLTSLLSIGIRGMSVIAGFLITYYIGHSYGPVANGQYALVAQTAMFLSIVAVGGMDLAVVRQFSATIAYRIPLARRSLLRALGYSLGAGLLIVIFLMALGPRHMSMLFNGKMPDHALVIICIVLMARTTTRLTAAVLRSQENHVVAQTIEVLVIPGTVAMLLAFRLISGLDEVLFATAGVGMLAAVYGIWKSFRHTGPREGSLDVTLRSMLRTSIPLWANTIALNIVDWYSLATAATALGVYDAGLFRVAFQIGGALSFSTMGMYNVFTARISAAIAVNDIERVARLCRAVTRLAVALLAPIAIVLLLFAEPLLGLISHEFRSAAPLLRIIVLGQILYVATGPAGLVLAMTGHERINLLNSSIVTGMLLIVAPIAAHMYGLFGLAFAVACVPFAGNLANLIVVHRLEKINVVTGHYFGPPVEPHYPVDEEAVDEIEARAEVESTRDFGATE